jgi:hypothetical protein
MPIHRDDYRTRYYALINDLLETGTPINAGEMLGVLERSLSVECPKPDGLYCSPDSIYGSLTVAESLVSQTVIEETRRRLDTLREISTPADEAPLVVAVTEGDSIAVLLSPPDKSQWTVNRIVLGDKTIWERKEAPNVKEQAAEIMSHLDESEKFHKQLFDKDTRQRLAMMAGEIVGETKGIPKPESADEAP